MSDVFKPEDFDPGLGRVDSYEQIIRDLVETADTLNQVNPMLSIGYYVDRAKALLSKAGE